MRTIRSKLGMISITMILALFLAPTLGHAAFSDIEHNWAKDAIISLEEQGFFAELWEEEFKPHSSIGQETVFQLVGQAFQLSSQERDDLAHWLNELLVAHPEGMTRGEFAALLANLLGLGEMNKVPQGWHSSFADLKSDYPGFMSIEVLQRLGLLPSHMQGRFVEPYRLITRSETAYLLEQALQLGKVEGTVQEPSPGEGSLVLKTTPGNERLTLELAADTLYVAPETMVKSWISTGGQLAKGQHIRVLTRDNEALLINAEQEGTTQVLLDGINKAGRALAEVLTPAQLSALVAGDWEQLGEEVRYGLYEELVERGLAPWEADALLKQDWSNLRIMAQERLTEEAADYFQITPEMVHAALIRDWPKVLEYAQVEVAQRLLTSDWLKSVTTD